MNEIKILIRNKRECDDVQEFCHSNGINWKAGSGSNYHFEFEHYNKDIVFFINDNVLTWLFKSDLEEENISTKDIISPVGFYSKFLDTMEIE